MAHYGDNERGCTTNYLKQIKGVSESGISERFLSSKVALIRLDYIGSCGDRTKHHQISLKTCIKLNHRMNSSALKNAVKT